ncbi:hypothetical protein [Acinetobacter ursingii]|uniref:hypothetical protein n=1 Tax=Acinetobacter ursingii TaxID=108980 RepID=UPI000F7B2564|nr:hypothetical protein [Acinetobacter ursingii]RSO82939.1 hypothetical protein EA748_08295 [Acinetobacter ursingii]
MIKNILIILKKKQEAVKPKKSGRKTLRTVGFDQDREYMLIGSDEKIKIETILERLSDAYNIDVKDILSKHTNLIK